MNDLQKRTWAEIHLGRLADNYHALRALAPESKFVGLVKANAYGHGAVPVAQKLTELGTDYLAVAATRNFTRRSWRKTTPCVGKSETLYTRGCPVSPSAAASCI